MAENEILTNNEGKLMKHAAVELSVAPNNTTAFLTITPPENGGADATVDMVMQAVRDADIRYGIQEEALIAAVENKRYNENICAAMWTPPVDGVDGTITYLFDQSSVIAPTEDEHGVVDFKNLGLVKNIFAGTEIAKITLPTEGTPGTDILGRSVSQHIGEPVRPVLGNGTVITPEGTAIVAAVDGNLTFANGAFNVSEDLYLSGSVDVSSGNLDFIGNIIIKGDVMEGYKVVSKKNISVTGTATGAELIADGDVTVRLGIINSTITAKGNVKVGFCENSKIHADGDVNGDSFVGGEVFAGKNINATGKGILMGGKYTALENITAGTIGSESYAKTLITLGNNAVLCEEADNLRNALKGHEDKVDQLGKVVTTLTEFEKSQKLSPERAQMKVEAMRSRFQLQGEIKRINTRLKEIEIELQCSQELEVSVRKFLYPGTTIRINNYVHIMNTTEQRVKASIYKGDIILRPLYGDL